jgi:hypothetical protein
MSAFTLVPASRTVQIPVIIQGCDTCFGVGKVWRVPGVLVPCPNGCTPIEDKAIELTVRTHALTALLEHAIKMVGGCLSCGCNAAACGSGCDCGCSACCDYPYPLPAVAVTIVTWTSCPDHGGA